MAFIYGICRPNITNGVSARQWYLPKVKVIVWIIKSAYLQVVLWCYSILRIRYASTICLHPIKKRLRDIIEILLNSMENGKSNKLLSFPVNVIYMIHDEGRINSYIYLQCPCTLVEQKYSVEYMNTTCACICDRVWLHFMVFHIIQ